MLEAEAVRTPVASAVAYVWVGLDVVRLRVAAVVAASRKPCSCRTVSRRALRAVSLRALRSFRYTYGDAAACRVGVGNIVVPTVFCLSTGWLRCRAGRGAGAGARSGRMRRRPAYLRLIDSCITQLKAQRPSRTCNESKAEEEEDLRETDPAGFVGTRCALEAGSS